MSATETLSARRVRTHVFTQEGVVKAVDDVSLTICQGQSLGLVGESGCGKTMMALSILRLVPDPPGRIVGGEIRFQGQDLLQLPERRMRAVRGKEIAMVFQEPSTSLNPAFSIGSQVREVIRFHQGRGRHVTDKAMDILEAVQIPDPRRILLQYPHELSVGMIQRVMIAMALSCEPSLLICDEPTTALDVSTQAQIVALLNELRTARGTTLLFITHDLGVLSWSCTHAAVMYAGSIVEYADIRTILDNPRHPYTQALIDSMPRLDEDVHSLHAIPGQVPDLARLPPGCKFRPRCHAAKTDCTWESPPLVEQEAGHWTACVCA